MSILPVLWFIIFLLLDTLHYIPYWEYVLVVAVVLGAGLAAVAGSAVAVMEWIFTLTISCVCMNTFAQYCGKDGFGLKQTLRFFHYIASPPIPKPTIAAILHSLLKSQCSLDMFNNYHNNLPVNFNWTNIFSV